VLCFQNISSIGSVSRVLKIDFEATWPPLQLDIRASSGPNPGSGASLWSVQYALGRPPRVVPISFLARYSSGRPCGRLLAREVFFPTEPLQPSLPAQNDRVIGLDTSLCQKIRSWAQEQTHFQHLVQNLDSTTLGFRPFLSPHACFSPENASYLRGMLLEIIEGGCSLRRVYSASPSNPYTPRFLIIFLNQSLKESNRKAFNHLVCRLFLVVLLAPDFRALSHSVWSSPPNCQG